MKSNAGCTSSCPSSTISGYTSSTISAYTSSHTMSSGTSGTTFGTTSGCTSGCTSSCTSMTISGYTSGTASGQTSGTTSGCTSGTTSGFPSGCTSYTTYIPAIISNNNKYCNILKVLCFIPFFNITCSLCETGCLEDRSFYQYSKDSNLFEEGTFFQDRLSNMSNKCSMPLLPLTTSNHRSGHVTSGTSRA